jgi:Tfp pilus assembly protein PilN
MPEKGFTATFVSNTGKTPRQFKIIGWKLYLIRVLMALFVLLVSAAAIIVAYGLINVEEIARLRENISQLQDSLIVRRNIEARLENMEYEIQQLHEFRQRLENITSHISAPEDSLEQ